MATDARRRQVLVESIHADQVALTRAVVRQHPPELLDTDLTMRQLQCLMLVAVEPGMTGQDLARRLGVRRPTVSGLLDRLIASGLVSRETDAHDRRRHPLRVSPSGAQLLGRLTDANLAAWEGLFAQVDLPVVEQMASALSALRSVVDVEPAEDEVSPSGEVTGVQVGVLQFAASLNVDDNLATITALAEKAATTLNANAGPVVLVAPEAAMCDFGPTAFDLTTVAQRLDGPFVNGLSALAKRLGVTIVAGMFERPPRKSARVYNTLVVLGPAGELVTSYRKIHLYDAFGYAESQRLLPGKVKPTTFELGGVTFGLMTCYDLRFPELAAALANAGAGALIVPAAWLAGPHKLDHWSTLVRARAIETTSYVVAADQCGRHYSGGSAVIDPMGLTVAELAAAPGVAVGSVDPERIALVRKVNPTLRNRRKWTEQ